MKKNPKWLRSLEIPPPRSTRQPRTQVSRFVQVCPGLSTALCHMRQANHFGGPPMAQRCAELSHTLSSYGGFVHTVVARKPRHPPIWDGWNMLKPYKSRDKPSLDGWNPINHGINQLVIRISSIHSISGQLDHFVPSFSWTAGKLLLEGSFRDSKSRSCKRKRIAIGGVPKWGYPLTSSISIGFSIINHRLDVLFLSSLTNYSNMAGFSILLQLLVVGNSRILKWRYCTIFQAIVWR